MVLFTAFSKHSGLASVNNTEDTKIILGNFKTIVHGRVGMYKVIIWTKIIEYQQKIIDNKSAVCSSSTRGHVDPS